MRAHGLRVARGAARCVAYAALCAAVLGTDPVRTSAQVTELPRSLTRGTLSALKAMAFAPSEIDAQDFVLDRVSGELAGATVVLEPSSAAFVRVATWVVAPRAVLAIRVPGASGGLVHYGGASHPLVAGSGVATAEIPIALLSDRSEPVTIEARVGERMASASYVVRFAPRAGQAALLMQDSSCSPWGIRVTRGALPRDSWLFLGCRLIRTERADDMAATLELYALWDNAGDEVQLDGARLRPVTGSLYVIRAASKPGHITLTAQGKSVTLAYGIPETLPAAFLGAGIGPYHYSLEDGRFSADTVTPLLTVYAGYTFTPDVRIVYFNATALHRRGYADNGLYLWLEQARMVDDRLSFNLLLGANMLVYSHDDEVRWRVTAPQGFELVYRDVFGRNYSAMLGAFLYPDLFDRSYYNVWLRWGSPQLFGELNYIHWKQPHSDGVTSSTSIGVSFGMPLAKFL